MTNSHADFVPPPRSSVKAAHDAGQVTQPHDAHVPDPARRRIITIALVSAGVVLAGLVAGAWYLQFWPGNFSGQTAETVSPETAGQWITVQPQAVTAQLDVMGTISPGKTVPVVAPFDGVIREQLVQLGDRVEIGTPLVVLDTSEITSRYRDAQSALLKAAIATEGIEQWESGPDVQRSRRALNAAEAALVTVEQQLTDLRALLDQGIVSRNEYEGLVQQRETQAAAVANAKDDLLATLERGSADNRQLLMLELENSQARVDDLKRQLDGATVVASVAGILTRPPANTSAQTPGTAEPGSSLTRGAPIFSIADISSFAVTGAVDEVDINRIEMGQPVTIQRDAVPGSVIPGSIVGVSAEADAEGRSGEAATFAVRAAFGATGEAGIEAIRIGMSARMTIETYSNPEALIIPAAAIIDAGTAPKVRLQRQDGIVIHPVVLGGAFPEGIEVLLGLEPGDQIVAP